VPAKSGKYITFLPMNESVLVSQKDETVLQLANRAGIHLNQTCGGFGTCGTCRVWVVDGLEKLGPRNEVEAEIAEDRKFNSAERLCCQMHPQDGLVLQIPEGTSE